MDPAGDVAQLLERQRDLAPRRGERVARLRLVRELPVEQAQLERQRDQPLLGAVVQVPLEPLALLLAGFDHTGAGASAPRPEPAAPPAAGVLERDPGRRAYRLEQLVLVVERRVVDSAATCSPLRSISVAVRASSSGTRTGRPFRST